jgi:hypothetical protein
MGRLDRSLYLSFALIPSSLILHTQLDNQFTSYHRIRTHRIKTRGPDVLRVLPDQPGVVRGAQDAGASTLLLILLSMTNELNGVYLHSQS